MTLADRLIPVLVWVVPIVGVVALGVLFVMVAGRLG